MASENYSPNLNFDKPVTIGDGETISSAVDIFGTSVVGVIVPAGFAGTEITFLAATTESGNYYAVKNSSDSAVTLTCQADAYYVFYPSDLAGVRYLKLVAGTTQTEDVILTLITRPL